MNLYEWRTRGCSILKEGVTLVEEDGKGRTKSITSRFNIATVVIRRRRRTASCVQVRSFLKLINHGFEVAK